MTRLNELINELCPDGVEYKTLGDVATIFRGGNFQKKDFVENGKPCIHYGQLYTHFKNSTDKTITFVSEEIFKKSKQAQPNDIVMAVTSENIEDVCSCVAWLGKENIAVSGHTAIIHHSQNSKYMSYFFHSESFFSQKIKLAHGTKVIEVTPDKLMNIKIPMPPLPVQEEIVRILDKFTSLEAELEARRVQYEYYRDELLKPKLEIPVVKLKDIATDFYRGSGIKRDEITAEGVPCVRYGEIYTTYNISFDKCVSHTRLEYVQSPKYFEHGDILFAITGENIEDIAKSVAYTGNEKCLAGGDIVVMKHKQNPRYLAHVLATTEARIQKGKGKVKSKVVHSSIPSIQEIEIPLPPLDVQERYANVLDNFDAICSDLKIGLPAEIDARKKQYEYYRDLLLTFAERGNTILTEQNRTDEIKLLQYVFGCFDKLSNQKLVFNNSAKDAVVQSSEKPVIEMDRNAVIEPAEMTGTDEFITLKDLFNTRNGHTPSTSNSEYWENGTIPWFVMDDIRKNGRVLSDSSQHITKSAVKKSGLFPANSIIVATSATIGEHALITADFLCNQRFTCLSLKDEFKDKVNMKYIFYYAFKLDEFCKANTTKSSFASVDMTKFYNFKFWLPPLAEQERIVKILDRFESLCNDISAGLPAEIKMRKKQYEFYRDKLLSFKEKANLI